MGDMMHVKEEEEEEEASRLSFSNFALRDNKKPGSLQHSPRSTDHFFEFFTSQTLPIYSNQGAIFCGKIIHQDEEEEEELSLNEFQKRDYFANLRSHSFRRSAIPARKENGHDNSYRRYSGSSRFSTPPSCREQSVNITALTSMSAKSRRIMFMFGPVKFNPEMDLSEIKQRLRREPAAPGKEVASSGGFGGSGRRLWSVVRSNLRFRWQLTKAFGCLPVVGGERRIIVGN